MAHSLARSVGTSDRAAALPSTPTPRETEHCPRPERKQRAIVQARYSGGHDTGSHLWCKRAGCWASISQQGPALPCWIRLAAVTSNHRGHKSAGLGAARIMCRLTEVPCAGVSGVRYQEPSAMQRAQATPAGSMNPDSQQCAWSRFERLLPDSADKAFAAL